MVGSDAESLHKYGDLEEELLEGSNTFSFSCKKLLPFEKMSFSHADQRVLPLKSWCCSSVFRTYTTFILLCVRSEVCKTGE